MGSGQTPLFSVVIPTRNRALALGVAIRSVLEQSFRGFEVIVVDDGSSEEHARRHRELIEAASGMARMLSLPPSRDGHGLSCGRNHGAAHSRGGYLCFLDDDDQWIDPQHLERVSRVVAASGAPIDLILANQQAFRGEVPLAGAIWIEDLQHRLPGAADAAGAYTVTAAELLGCQAHCHLNTTIASRAFFLILGGLDEGLRYEEDVDFFLRAIDHAGLIKYLPVTVSRHNVPDPATRASLSTRESELAKRLYQLRVCDKAVLFSQRPELRRYAMRRRAYILRHIATEAARSGRFDCAVYYAREALMTKFSLGWLATTALFALRRGRLAPSL